MQLLEPPKLSPTYQPGFVLSIGRMPHAQRNHTGIPERTPFGLWAMTRSPAAARQPTSFLNEPVSSAARLIGGGDRLRLEEACAPPSASRPELCHDPFAEG